MIVLETVNLKKYYGVEPNITKALDGINFTVEKENLWLSLVHQEVVNQLC